MHDILKRGLCAALLAGAALGLVYPLPAAETATPTEMLANFSSVWSEDAWTQRGGRWPDGYMLETGHAQWQTRMKTFHALVATGETARPDMFTALKRADTPGRILAAQALGYLPAGEDVQPLLAALKNDPDPAVRLYAADVIGMWGQAAAVADKLRELREQESNRDVKMHITYALERGDEPLKREITQTLVDWEVSQLDSARVEQPAPEFALQAVTGERVALEDFRGQRNVVLVFIYGDT